MAETIAPDFSHLALAHLQVHGDAFCDHVKAYIEKPANDRLVQLIDDIQRFRNTLVLLDKRGAVFVAEEIHALLNAAANGVVTDRQELANVLVLAGDKFSDHVAMLKRDGNYDSALPMLPLVNDSRACRAASLLSDSVVLAAGIELPDSVMQPVELAASLNPVLVRQESAEWHACISQARPQVMRELLGWFQNSDTLPSDVLIGEFRRFMECAADRESLAALVPLMQSTTALLQSLKEETSENSPAMRRLFGQIERWLYQADGASNGDELNSVVVPPALLRNCLYFVAQVQGTSRLAMQLRRQFRLERIRHNPQNEQGDPDAGIGIAYHLSNAIRDSIDAQTADLREWLDQPATRGDHPQVQRLNLQLQQLEPVLTLMGSESALHSLQHINATLLSLQSAETVDSGTRLNLAESLIRLDRALDEVGRKSLGVPVQQSNRSGIDGDDVFVDMATDACLTEARGVLHGVAGEIEDAIKEGGMSSYRQAPLIKRLHTVDNALQIIPLPEMRPLFGGLCEVVSRLDQPLGAKAIDALTTLLVSMDYYLGCVLQPQPAAGQLLVDAEDALAVVLENDLKVTEQPAANDDVFMAAVLNEMSVIGAGLSTLRGENADQSSRAVASLSESFARLEALAKESDAGEVQEIAERSSALLDRHAERPSVPDEDVVLLEEVHAVLPQLLAQRQGGSDEVRGLDTLVADLARLEDDVTPVGEDQTLQDVFHRECRTHIDVLGAAVEGALQGSTLNLPTENMLRALHTLTGSAQTVGASNIVALVQPLQRATLDRQRRGERFDRAETEYIGELVDALSARLDASSNGGDVSPRIIAIEQRMPLLLRDTAPTPVRAESGLEVLPEVDSLAAVFDQEARELLADFSTATDDTRDPVAALAVLHTLKGSARMAGQHAIADHAHALEGRVQKLSDTGEQLAALDAGRAGLSELLLLQTTPVETPVPADEVASGFAMPPMKDSAFDKLLNLATELSVNQARVSEDLLRLKDVTRDLDIAAVRWQHIASQPGALDEQLQSSAAVREMLADVKAAREALSAALHQVDSEHQLASRASTALHQSLVRSRLVRIDEARERLSQAMRDASSAVERKNGYVVDVELTIDNGDITLDRTLYRQLLGPLEHLVRNAVVHGIESPAMRSRLGKNTLGLLTLDASLDGTDLVLRFTDDGSGVDLVSINEKRQNAGLDILESQADMQREVFRAGFSTLNHAHEAAGRGLGLAAVQQSVAQLGGTAQLVSNAGEGTVVTLRVPQRLVVSQAVLVKSRGSLFAIPVTAVEAVQTDVDGRSMTDERKPMPLSELLGQGVASSRSSPGALHTASAARPRVTVKVHGDELLLEVDAVIGYRELIMQPLGPQLARLQRFAGGSVLADGRQVLILDLPRVLEKTETRPVPQRRLQDALRPVALLVDDSLTLRVAADSMLQSWGIATRFARDGLEALDSVSTSVPDILIIDIDMPRLDGFGLLERLNSELGDSRPPVIVISSRDNKVDRDRMAALGARRFLAKPYQEHELQEALAAVGLRLPDLTIA